MPKGVPNKRYTPEFKKLVIETMQEEKLSYSETCRRFEVNSRDRIKSWERIYLEEGPEGFAVERRGRSSKGRPPKQLPKQVEEDLLAEVQRLRAEVRLPKKFASLGFGRRATPAQKTLVVQNLRQKHALQYSALNRSTAPCNFLLSSEADAERQTNMHLLRKKSQRFTTKTGVDTAIAGSRQNFASAISS